MKIQILKDGCYLNPILEQPHTGELIYTFDNVRSVKFLANQALIWFESNTEYHYQMQLEYINKILK